LFGALARLMRYRANEISWPLCLMTELGECTRTKELNFCSELDTFQFKQASRDLAIGIWSFSTKSEVSSQILWSFRVQYSCHRSRCHQHSLSSPWRPHLSCPVFRFTGLLITLLLSLPIAAPNKDVNLQLVASINLATPTITAVGGLGQRLYLQLMDDPLYTCIPDSICNADIAESEWQSLGSTSGLAASFPPYRHHATNLVVAVSGTTHTYMFPEDGSRLVQIMLSLGMMTAFPNASLHTMASGSLKYRHRIAKIVSCGNNQFLSF